MSGSGSPCRRRRDPLSRRRATVAPPGDTHAAWRPLITAWRRPRPLEIPEGSLRVCVLARRRQRPPDRRTYPREEPLDRRAPEGEPALELGLDGQVGADLGLQAQLAIVVALLGSAAGDEGIERAALVVVDPVHAAALLVAEREHRAQDALAVAAGLDRRG